MKALKNLRRSLASLHRDEQGADMVEYVLIMAAIALPLLAVIIWFWEDFSKWAKEVYDNVRGGGGETNPDDL